MLNNIKRQLKFHRISTIFIVISYIITIVFISVGISYLNETKNIYLDNNSGQDGRNSLLLSIDFDNSFKVDNFIKYIVNKNYKYDIKTYSTVKIGSKDIVVWGHKFKNHPYWQPNILSGSYLGNNIYANEKVAVVGSDLKENCFWKNKKQYISLGGDNFSVLGFVGRKSRRVPWSNTVYIPMQSLNKSMMSHLLKKGELQLLFLSNSTILDTEENAIVNELKNKFNNINIAKISNNNESNNSSLGNVLMISTLIFIVSIVNIMAMTLFWILDKRKEIAVRKVLGFTNSDIIKLILKEMMGLGSIAVFFAFIMQLLLNIFICNFLKMDMPIEINNIIVSILTVLVSIFITSIVPIKIILKVKLTEILNL